MELFNKKGKQDTYYKQYLFLLTEGSIFPAISNILLHKNKLFYTKRSKDSPKIFTIKEKDINFLVNICFESLFFIRDIKGHDVDMLINVANQSMFSETLYKEINLKISKYRAIELGIPVVIVSNTGLSSIISYTGKVLYSLPESKKFVQDILLTTYKHPTVFSIIYMQQVVVFVVLFYLILLLFLLYRRN